MKDKIEMVIRLRMVFLLLSFLVSVNFISAVNIGISPASIRFDNVIRDGYAERTVVISTDSLEDVFVDSEVRGDIANWINFSSVHFNVSRDHPYYLKISVNPPKDIPNGNYSGFVRVITSSLGESVEGHAVGRVRSSLDLLVDVVVTDVEVVSCGFSKLEVFSAEKGDDVVFKMNFANNGNVRLKPSIDIDVWDSDQVSIVKSKSFLGKEILPTTDGDLELRLSSDDLDLGQYWSDVSFLDCDSSETLTFDVLKKGALWAKGELLSIVSRQRSPTGETIPVEVNFKNTGEKEVEAYFKGKVSLNGKIFQLLESEKLVVPISKVEKFNFYFTPKIPGKYIVSGRVFYSGKKTFESSIPIEVFSSGFNYTKLLITFIYIFFIILIAVLLYKIKKQRKSYLRKIRRFK